ncbi:MAG TPA: hypothetical protein VF765_29110 [Polyangiaceae bacterium]
MDPGALDYVAHGHEMGMKVRARLVSVAALLIAGNVATAGCSNGGGVNYGCPDSTNITVTPAQACQMLAEQAGNLFVGASTGPTCQALCADAAFYGQCDLPPLFVSEAKSLNPRALSTPSDGGVGVLVCPPSTSAVTVTCRVSCIGGRLTDGYCAPAGLGSEGARLAAMAYLEAVSVHAFERLERELEAHRAPPTLLREARRARRDEVRHTAMTTRLARRHGISPRIPDSPAPARARTLLEVAIENAVEGCIRETYGAVLGLVEAQTSPNNSIRRAMKSIASDECRHADLAWAVHAWAMPRLTGDDRRAVQRAMKDAVTEIAASDPRTASMLFS